VGVAAGIGSSPLAVKLALQDSSRKKEGPVSTSVETGLFSFQLVL
jgi:hypothetical protein